MGFVDRVTKPYVRRFPTFPHTSPAFPSMCTKFIFLIAYLALILKECDCGNWRHAENVLELLHKLEGLVENLKEPEKSEDSLSETTTLISTTLKATSTTTKKATTLAPGMVQITMKNFVPDAKKNYCNEAVCTLPACSEKDITRYGLMRKAVKMPKIYSVCDGFKMLISLLRLPIIAAGDSCCTYNSSVASFTTDKFLNCFKELHLAEKKSKAVQANTFWTSAKFAPECNSYVWCPEKEIIKESDPMWRGGFPKRSSGDCLAIQVNNADPKENGLYNFNCSVALGFMCYGPAEMIGD
ncbi:uncharacterized protein LOC135948194 [Cloeon dipterum]|uniref:uncharacterized protein LOC135948194 n=1 Tax=Cloeon dipterum TaxID=197152 RepID=UPI00321FD799